MRDPQFFNWLRPANRIVFFGVGVLLLAVLSYVAYQIYRDIVRDRSVIGVVNPTLPSASNQQTVSLDPFTAIEGTPYMLSSIRAEQEYRQDYSSKTALSTRNYLILNLKTRSAVRLVPQNDWLFLAAAKVGQQNAKGELVSAKGLWYQIVKADTNGDKRLTEADATTIAMSEVSGENYTEVLPRVDRVLNAIQPNAKTLLLVYETNKQNFISEIDVTTRQLLSTRELPALE